MSSIPFLSLCPLFTSLCLSGLLHSLGFLPSSWSAGHLCTASILPLKPPPPSPIPVVAYNCFTTTTALFNLHRQPFSLSPWLHIAEAHPHLFVVSLPNNWPLRERNRHGNSINQYHSFNTLHLPTQLTT